MKRRLVLCFGATLLGAGLRAQPAAAGLRRIGVLAPGNAAKEAATLKPFFDEMQRLGWTEGRNIAYDRAFADDRTDQLPRIAAELVARKPELIYAPPAMAAVAARQATRTIPIVFGSGVDPVGMGLVDSLARPGGKVTGISSDAGSLAPRRVQLLRELLPKARRIGLIGDVNDPTVRLEHAALAALDPALGIAIPQIVLLQADRVIE